MSLDALIQLGAKELAIGTVLFASEAAIPLTFTFGSIIGTTISRDVSDLVQAMRQNPKDVRFASAGSSMNDVHKYTYRVTWSENDQEHVGLCAEFPSLSSLHKNELEAFRGIHELVKCVVDEMVTSGEGLPEPLAARQYSGEFRVRIPPALHRELVVEAAENKVSLNRLISMKLARP